MAAIDQLSDAAIDARRILSHFTPEKPLMVGKAMYAAMAREPAFADMMDRVRTYPEL